MIRTIQACFLTTALLLAPLIQSYDIFMTPVARTQRAQEQLATAINTVAHDARIDLHALQNITAVTTDQGVVKIFEAIAQAIVQKQQENAEISINSVECAVSMNCLLLERMITAYYQHLDNLETASMYWEWAEHNSNSYFFSKSPTKWFSGPSQYTEIADKEASIEQLRTLYTQQFGEMVRLLEEYHYCEHESDKLNWLRFAQRFMQTMFGTYGIQPIDARVCAEYAQKWSVYHSQMHSAVNAVAQPGWFTRHWMPMLAGTVAAAAGAYYYANNTPAVNTSYAASLKYMQNFWHSNVMAPINDLKNAVMETFRGSPDTISAVNNADEIVEDYNVLVMFDRHGDIKTLSRPKAIQLTEKQAWALGREARLQGIEELGGNKKLGSDMTSVPVLSTLLGYFDRKTDPVTKIANGLNLDIDHIFKIVDRNENKVNKILQGNSINFALLALIPATVAVGVTSLAGCKIFSWLRKKDRRLLRLRLSQAEGLLIRANHPMLEDGEYGRLLYLLMKEHEQVAKNVVSDERAAFLEDLRYLAGSHPSVEQKKEIIKTMWRKYQSLALTA